MSTKKFLDSSGLAHFWDKAKEYIEDNTIPKVDNASGNLAQIDSSGNVVDSGVSKSRFALSEQGIPSGGLQNQVLAKTGSGNYNVSWKTPSYSDLDSSSKPKINGVALDGNKDSSTLGLASKAQGDNADTVFSNYLKADASYGESSVTGFDPFADTVHNSVQALSPTQQAQVRQNINAQQTITNVVAISTEDASASFSGGTLTLGLPKGKDAVNPFKGWYDSSSNLPANPAVGDYAYVKGASTTDPAAIYECTTAGSWSDSGRTADTSNVQTFASSEELNQVAIDDSHLVNPVNTVDNTQPVLAQAEDVMQLKVKLEGVTAQESKVTPIEDWYPEGSSSGYYNTSKVWTTNINFVSTRISINGYKKVRFIGYNKSFTTKYAYGFLDADSQPIGDFIEYYNNTVQTEGKCELEVKVPVGAAYFVCLRQAWSTNSSYQMFQSSDFYCYLQSGTSVGEEIADKVSYSDMEGLWMWKKNLINQDDLKRGGIYTQSGDWNNTGSAASGIVSNKLYLEDGVTYTVSNVNGYKVLPVEVGDKCILCITKFNANGDFLETYRPEGTVIATDSDSPNAIAATSTFTYFKHRDAETGEIDEEYCVIRLRYNASTSTSYPNTFNSYKSAQVEVGNEITELAPYLSEKLFDIATKRYVDDKIAEEIESIQEQIELNFPFLHPLYPIEEYNTQTISQASLAVDENIENAFVSSNNFSLKLFKVKPSTKYILSGKASRTDNSGIYVYYWADENKNYISKNLSMGGSNYEWGIDEEYSIVSPDNAAYLYVKQVRANNETGTVYSNLWCYTVYEETTFDSQEQYESMFSDTKELTILSIGNSYSEDMFGYVPYIMRKIAPNVRFTALMLMQSADTSVEPPKGVPSAHYRNFVDNNAVYFYSRWYYDRFAWRQSGGYNVSIKSALRGKSITYVNDIETEGDYIDPENRPKIDVVFLQASASSGNFKYTTGLMKQITDYLGYPVKFALFSSPYRASTTNNGNAYSYENILKGALGNLVFAKKYSDLTNTAFLVSGCAAIQNARTIEALRLTGSYMDQSNNTSGYGYLSCIDGNHISDGIGRQTNAYTVVGTLLKIMGMDWKGIVGDKTVMDGPTVKWINCPHAHPGTVSSNGNPNTYGTDASTVALAQYCASMAIEHPFDIFNLSNYNAEVSYEGEDTMEFKRFYRIYTTVPTGVSLSNSQTVITEGEDYDSTITGTVNSIKILLGKLDITAFTYNSETHAIHIGNVSDTVNIAIN